MSRVKPSEARDGVTLTQGIPFFKWEMDKKYKLVFPIPKGEEDVFLYQGATHNIRINGKFRKKRCVHSDYQVTESSKDQVIKVDENGEYLKDPASGRVLNDGTCPLCELEYLYRQWIFNDVEEWKKNNPDAGKKEISAQYKSRFDKSPVDSAYNRNKDDVLKINTSNFILGVVYKLDDKDSIVLDKDGFPVYEVNVFDLSESRFSKLMDAAETNKEYMSDSLSSITDEDGFAWTEFVWSFPKRDDKALSGKDLTISIVPSGHSAVEKYDALEDKIKEELSDIETLENVFENLPALKVNSIPNLEKDLQGKLQQYRKEMSESEEEELSDKLSEDEKYISSEDAEKLLDKDVGTSGAEDFKDKAESGSDSFLV